MTLDLAQDTTATQLVCFAAPLLPGTTSADREEMLSCRHGARTDQHATSRRRHRITHESVWIQNTPAGDVAIVLIESPDLANALLWIATSQEPFDVWFREHLRTVHGLGLTDGMTLPEQVLDFRG